MIHLLAAAVLSTATIDGSADASGGDYILETFEVPPGAVEILIERTVTDDANVLDFGVFSPDGFRGWGGGLSDPAIIGTNESSRGYAIGALTPGTWTVVVGKAKLAVVPATYQVVVTISDEATLAVRDRATFSERVLEVGPRWYAGDLHVHSSESGDASATLAEIAQLAEERGLDFVALSDHNTVSQHDLAEAFSVARGSGPLFIRANEVTTYSGHGNALGAPVTIDHRLGVDSRTRTEIVGDVSAAGGLFVINHPTLDLGSACIGCAWPVDGTPWSQIAAIEIQTGPFSLAPLFGASARDVWDEALDDGHRITAVGGSDDHRAGIDLSSTQSPIGSPTTLVYADELSEQAILEAIAAGRVIVLHEGPGDPRVTLEIENSAGDLVALGDSVSGEAITVRAEVTGGNGMSAVLVAAGVEGEVQAIGSESESLEWRVRVPEGGSRYRVHVNDAGQVRTVTNHVYATYAADPSSGCGCRSAGQRSPAEGFGFLGFLVAGLIACGFRRRVKRHSTR